MITSSRTSIRCSTSVAYRYLRAPRTAANDAGFSTLDASAIKENGHTFNGSGNSASGWETQTSGSFQLGSDIHYRQGDTAQPVAVDRPRRFVYNMPAGAQVTDSSHGVFTSHANRAATSFDFSFDTGVGGSHQTIHDFLASGGQFIFKIDLDPTRVTIR